jgi:hypothetical protein
MLRSAESASLLISAVSATMLTVAVLTTGPLVPESSPIGVQELDVSIGLPLDRVANAERVLPTLRVETSKGVKIGEVKAVKIGPQGIEAVTVKTRGLLGVGGRTATMKADDLVYMPGRNSLVSRLTGTELSNQSQKRKKARL